MTSNATPPVDRLLAPFREFSRASASSGVLLIAAAAVALFWANSPLASAYADLWGTELAIDLGGLHLSESLLHWVNDGLMAVFFLVVGLEIKREILVGELATLRRATLPIAAAMGGAVLPALIFLGLAGGGTAARGWGVPMATDIAFALGVLALLGTRAPLGLRIFVTALAIVDDLLAVVVIAIFYTSDLSLPALAGRRRCARSSDRRQSDRRPSSIGLWIAGPRLVACGVRVGDSRDRRGRAARTDDPRDDTPGFRRLRRAREVAYRRLRRSHRRRRGREHPGASRCPLGAGGGDRARTGPDAADRARAPSVGGVSHRPAVRASRTRASMCKPVSHPRWEARCRSP